MTTLMTGSLFGRKSDKTRMDEELALQVAQMIINDVTTTTRSHDPSSTGHDPAVTTTTRSNDPSSSDHDVDSGSRDQSRDPKPSSSASLNL